MGHSAVTRSTVEALDLLDDALGSIDHAQRAGLSHGQRLDLMWRSRKLSQRMRTLAAVLTGEAERADSARVVAGTGLTSLLAAEEHTDTRQATGEVNQARDLARHPRVAEAALDGEVSVAHAQGIAKGMRQLPRGLGRDAREAAEAEFLRHAQTSTPRQIEGKADEVLAVVAPELVPDPTEADRLLVEQRARAMKRRSVLWGPAGDGATWIKAVLPHLEAEAIIGQLEARVATDRRLQRDQARATRNTRPGVRVLRGHRTEDPTPEQRRADALVALLNPGTTKRESGSAVPRVVITINETDLREKALGAGILASGQKIPAGTLRRMLCDASVLPIVLGAESQILDLGQEQRLTPPGLRRALEYRDKGCIFPGCTTPMVECDAHHIVPWWNFGPTSLGNLCLVCRHHHGLIEPERREGEDLAWKWHIVFNPRTRKPEVRPPRRLADGFQTPQPWPVTALARTG